MQIADSRISYDKPVVAKGRLAPEYAGREVQLEFRSRGAWQALARTAAGANGSWRFAVKLPRSAVIRVTLQAAPGAAVASSEPPRSRERKVAVTSVVRVGKRRLDVRAGRPAWVRGRAFPATRGRKVALQVRKGGRWVTLDRARTRASGAFRLRKHVRTSLDLRARVTVAKGGGLAKSGRRLGRLQVYRYTHASWYGPGFWGQRTGCGGRLGYNQMGVAHKSLPCGTMVTFRHRGRSVRVPVIDRGPYIAGREYDLTAPVARKLRFRGHGAILVSR